MDRPYCFQDKVQFLGPVLKARHNLAPPHLSILTYLSSPTLVRGWLAPASCDMLFLGSGRPLPLGNPPPEEPSPPGSPSTCLPVAGPLVQLWGLSQDLD